MDKVPAMISTKDLDYIKDMLNWNLVAAKKANHYLSHVQDEEVKTIIENVALMHTNHYNFILNFLR
ncbi:MAG: spore coat protein [Bacilli bacterium]|jgi:hypothetical protein|nr:spore coat protein [Bacilli bacterium]